LAAHLQPLGSPFPRRSDPLSVEDRRPRDGIGSVLVRVRFPPMHLGGDVVALRRLVFGSHAGRTRFSLFRKFFESG
jgi:hypothetical protein